MRFIFPILAACLVLCSAQASPTRPEGGITVISDIDDTVKDTRLWLFGWRHFCLNPLAIFSIISPQPVKGMPELYQHWQNQWDCEFNYVTAQPPARGKATIHFLQEAHLPLARPERKHVFFRETRVTLFHFLASPRYKSQRIQPLIAQWLRADSKRRFILVGDSGEYDPEGYGELARDSRNHIAAIYIRQATRGDSPRGPRYAKAFRGVPESHWQIFVRPDQIAGLPGVGRLRSLQKSGH